MRRSGVFIRLRYDSYDRFFLCHGGWRRNDPNVYREKHSKKTGRAK